MFVGSYKSLVTYSCCAAKPASMLQIWFTQGGSRQEPSGDWPDCIVCVCINCDPRKFNPACRSGRHQVENEQIKCGLLDSWALFFFHILTATYRRCFACSLHLSKQVCLVTSTWKLCARSHTGSASSAYFDLSVAQWRPYIEEQLAICVSPWILF